MNPEHYEFMVGFNPQPEERELTVLFSGEGRPIPGHKMGPSVHDYYLIHTVLTGEGHFQSGSLSQTCRAGDTFVIFPGSLFSYQADSSNPWHYAWVALQGEDVQQLFAEVGIIRGRPLQQAANVAELHHLYERIRLSFKQSAYPRLENLEASGWLRLLLCQLGLANAASLPEHSVLLPDVIELQIDQAIRWLSLQFHQQISIDQLASTLGYHRAHLSKVFKQRTGLSPKQYLLKVRMDKAQALLNGPLTIDQVATSVGYNDALYFSRHFRKWCGMSPSEFRSSLR
ncbi:AraC family transcriptional regulator [Paenibacillus donghaensis]|uniref:AraC family transcriptional regulator n=1 Tax=Paenibacillus donghaensis TaxID=414771 RepID=A0A2Z2KNL1_9BACL|nr:AraC family transcriptional regulator [Paenibacillus donghaensis]ASA21701.1 AraC family transcriptional regulator [Paenibacillus donghaensis]